MWSIILKDVFLCLLTPCDLKVYIKQLFKCFKWKYWVLHIILSFIKLVLKIELLNQLVHNPQSNIHGYILRFHYIHYQYNTAFKSLLCLGFTFGSAGFVGSTGGVVGVTQLSSHAHLDVNVIFSEKPEEPLKIKSKFNTCSRNTIPRVKISLNKNSCFTYFAQCKHSFPPCNLRVFRYSCFSAPRE